MGETAGPVFASSWLGVTLFYVLAAFGLGRLTVWRHVTSQGPLLAAVALVTFGVSNLVLENSPFAPHYPLFSTPVRALFFVYFIVFAGGRFVMRQTRWLLIVFGAVLMRLPEPHATVSALHSPAAAFTGLENAGRLLLLVVLAPQMLRYRDSPVAGERWSTRRVLVGCGVGMALLFVSAWLSPAVNGSALFFFGRTAWYTVFSLAPVAVGLGLMRGQLYDCAAVERRALIWGLVTAGLSLAFFGFIGLSPFLLLLPAQAQPALPFLATLLATLLVVVLFPPLRRVVQASIDRQFYRHLYEAARKFGEFAETVHEEVRLDALGERTIALLQSTLQPRAVTLWVRTQLATESETLPANGRQRKPARPSDLDQSAMHLYCLDRTDKDAPRPLALTISPGDPLHAALYRAFGPVALDKLPADSEAAAGLRAAGMASAQGLVDRGKLVGLICLSEQPRAFDVRALLAGLGADLAPALRVAQREHEQDEQVHLRERIDQEMQTAQRIQRAFLPQATPALAGWQITPYYQPAREVGGDFYDFLMLPDRRLGIVIGDVSGKGVPAALVMAATRSMLRASAQQLGLPGEVLAQVNELLCGDLPASVFVTCFYAILDPPSGRLRFANAGHELPYHRHQRSTQQLRARGMPLGLMPGSGYEEHETVVQPDDHLLFLTDGLVEAHNRQRDMFGSARVAQVLEEVQDGSEIIERALADLASFTRPDWEQEDDITLVAVRRRTSVEDQVAVRAQGASVPA